MLVREPQPCERNQGVVGDPHMALAIPTNFINFGRYIGIIASNGFRVLVCFVVFFSPCNLRMVLRYTFIILLASFCCLFPFPWESYRKINAMSFLESSQNRSESLRQSQSDSQEDIARQEDPMQKGYDMI